MNLEKLQVGVSKVQDMHKNSKMCINVNLGGQKGQTNQRLHIWEYINVCMSEALFK